MNTYFRTIIWGAFFIIGFTHCTKEVTIERTKVQKQQQGATILSGQGAPSPQLGKVGDFYIDMTQALLYGAKTQAGWGTPIALKGENGKNGTNGKDGANGQDGQDGQNGQNGQNGQDGQNGANGQDGQNGRDGANIHQGTTPPDDAVGKIGDLYFDTAHAKLYGPKTSQGWGQGMVLGATTTLRVNKTKVIVPMGHFGSVTITLGSGQYQLDVPPTQQIADIALQNAQRSTILIKGIKQGTTTLTLHDTHTNEQLSIEVLVSIPPSSYLLEDNGTTLVRWIGRETEIDMDADPILKNVTKIKSDIFSVLPPPLVTRIKFNEGLTTIEKDAFYNYTKLTEVEFPTTLTHIGSNAFFNTRIVHLSIPANVTTIENGAFAQNEALETLTLHEGIQTLGTGVFQLCNKLQSVVIPNSVTTMGRQCFSHCTSLSSVTLPQGIQVLEEFLFSSCPNLTQLTIPNSVTQIKDGALGKHLSQIIIPASVTHLGNLNSTVLTTLILKGSTPPDLAGKNYFFYHLPNLQHIYVPAGSVASYQNAEIWNKRSYLIKAEP